MAVMFFGQYLVENGIVSRDTLVKAIELQEKTNLSFGDTAVKMGLLTPEDAERVNLAQRSEDMRIGDLAVKMGLLTEEQVVGILAEQKRNHLYIGEALVRVGGLTPENLPIHLARFKESQAEYATQTNLVPDDLPHRQILEMIVDLTGKMITRVAHLTFHTEPCVVDTEFPPLPVTATMEIHGDLGLTYVFGCSDGFQKRIAQAILASESIDDEPAEILDDTVMEFVNVVCGNVVAKAAQKGISLDISPPRIVRSVPERFNARKILVTYRLPDGEYGCLGVAITL